MFFSNIQILLDVNQEFPASFLIDLYTKDFNLNIKLKVVMANCRHHS